MLRIGLGLLNPEDGLRALGLALNAAAIATGCGGGGAAGGATVAVCSFDWPRYKAHHAAAITRESSFFSAAHYSSAATTGGSATTTRTNGAGIIENVKGDAAGATSGDAASRRVDHVVAVAFDAREAAEKSVAAALESVLGADGVPSPHAPLMVGRGKKRFNYTTLPSIHLHECHLQTTNQYVYELVRVPRIQANE